MVKEQLIELVRKKFEAIPELNIAHEETVSLYISMAFSQIIYDTFRKNPRDLDLYSYPYTVQVANGQATLPVAFYQLPQNAHIRSVHPTEDSSTMIVPVPQGGNTLYANLDVGLVDTTISYTISGRNIYFDGLNAETTSVKMWIVTAFDALGYETDVCVPSGKGVDFMQVVVQIAMNTPPNLKNDG